jgi:tetratricopeptide (TPR) repeat protein
MNLAVMRTEAQSRIKLRDLEGARELLERILSVDARDASTWNLLGAVFGMMGNTTEAERCCRRAIASDPLLHGAHINLANALSAANRLVEAEQAYRTALRLNPRDPQAHNNLGNLLRRLGQHAEAEQVYRTALAMRPDYPEAWNNLGTVLWDMARAREASDAFRRAIALNPRYADAYVNLGTVFVGDLRMTEARACFEQALRVDQRSLRAQVSIGKAHQTEGAFDEARKRFEHALALAPDDMEAICALATLRERIGDFAGAYEILQPLRTRATNNALVALAYAPLARKRGEAPEAIQTLESALATTNGAQDRADLHFALGDLLDAGGRFDEAFRHYSEGNLLWAPPFDLDAEKRMVETLVNVFSRERLANMPRAATPSNRAIFIVGMPRSGTSLIEQILSSHPGVSGGGEMNSVGQIAPAVTRDWQPEASLVNQLAQTLNTQLRAVDPQSARITDKTPHHFLYLGLISIIAPGARVIHCQRDPRDTCLSIYFHRFNQFHAYACDLGRLGRYYRLYEQVMAHWRDALDLPFFEINYEDVVAEPERRIRELVGFCGLEWDDRCMDFHASSRVVNTPSYDQVRRPLYSSSVGRWRNYEQHLGPLLAEFPEGLSS